MNGLVKCIFLCGCLLVNQAVRATGGDELYRIKKNYRSIAKPSIGLWIIGFQRN